jgi:putative PIN family toxin of toxin-antitoxin system
MRLVLDTYVIVAAMRSPTGASAALLEAALEGALTLLANVALILEYEAVCLREEHQVAAGLSTREGMIFVDAVAALAVPVRSHYIWRPQLKDPADEMVLEAAVNGQAEGIVTFNRRDFGEAPKRFGVSLWLPGQVLRKYRGSGIQLRSNNE